MTADGVGVIAIAAAIGFGAIAVFQLAIALGAPVGRASWGGRHDGVLPQRLRAASAVAIVGWAAAALVILGRAEIGPLSGEAIRWMAWVLVGVLALAAPVNAASKSPWERYGWAPFTLALAAACAVVAAS